MIIKMYTIDSKSTIWNRSEIKNESDLPKIIEKIKKGHSVAELFDEFELTDSELMYDTEESLTPSENYGRSTINILNGTNGETMFENSDDIQTIFYVVEEQFELLDDFIKESTGNKQITAYRIECDEMTELVNEVINTNDNTLDFLKEKIVAKTNSNFKFNFKQL